MGNPNSGKTSLFNALTGARLKVGNYPGITVERIEGWTHLPGGRNANLIDLPGSYSLAATSMDEQIARDAILGRAPGMPRPDVVVAVVDAGNLERNLYLTTQVLGTGVPMVVALNMVDVADRRKAPVDAAKLEAALGVPVVPVIARTGVGIEELREAITNARVGESVVDLPGNVRSAVALVSSALGDLVPETGRDGDALRLVASASDDDTLLVAGGAKLAEAVTMARDALARADVDVEALEPELRYAACRRIAEDVRPVRGDTKGRVSERADRFLTHRFIGPVIFVFVMGLIFWSVYAWATPFMDLIEAGTGWLQGAVADLLGEGMLTDLLVDGVIAGVGNIIIFLPQICILFFFLTVLEDIGYLARGAFLIDRLMAGVGLHGKAFVPMMSSFACAIPGIMATRAMSDRRDRMVTILVAPLMSCSARLPVYALMIGAFIPAGYQGLTLLSMYVLSVVAALVAAWIFRKTLFRGENSTFMLELPGYKLPQVKAVLRTVGAKGWVFVRYAGTVILAISVVLWALSYFPRSAEVAAEAEVRMAAGLASIPDPEAHPDAVEAIEAEVNDWAAGEQLAQSYAGQFGHAMEPLIEPLGMDWKMGIGLVASFAAREVLVSTLAVVYSVGEEDDEETPALREQLKQSRKPDGSPSFTWLTALSVMVFFVLACQCMSTLAVVKRETNSYRWPVFMFVYMTAAAYVASLIVYQGGLALGFG